MKHPLDPDPAQPGIDNLQGSEEIRALLRHLQSLGEEHDGNNRVQIKVWNKHTGEELVSGEDGPIFDLGLLSYEAEKAERALLFVLLMKNFRDRSYPGV